MSLIKSEGKITSYKPFAYPEAYERYKKHEAAHWLPEELHLGEDVKDWAEIGEKDRAFLHTILNLFTQSDVEVGNGYDILLRIFKPTEVKMMLRGAAARENIHADGYSLFQDTIGLDEHTYSEFLDVPQMYEKMKYVIDNRVKKYEEYASDSYNDSPTLLPSAREKDIDRRYRVDVAKMLAIYGALVEGVSLFSSFAMLLNYQRWNRFPGLCQIVTWSIRDEEMHSQNNAWLFKQFIKENKDIWSDSLKKQIYQAARDVVEMEDAFINYVFDKGYTNGLSREEMQQYIRYIADRRLLDLGLKANFGVSNPLKWMEELLSAPEFADFFSVTSTEYSKGMLRGSWDDVRNFYLAKPLSKSTK